MKKDKRSKEHPEVENLKTVCDVSPGAKSTQPVCDKVYKEKSLNPKNKK